MGKVVVIGEFLDRLKKVRFKSRFNEMLKSIEEEFDMEEEPLTVLTDDATLELANKLIDARDSINDCLSLLNVEEVDELPEGLNDV